MVHMGSHDLGLLMLARVGCPPLHVCFGGQTNSEEGAMQCSLRRHTSLQATPSDKSPLDMATSSSAGADAVVNLVRRAEAGVAV